MKPTYPNTPKVIHRRKQIAGYTANYRAEDPARSQKQWRDYRARKLLKLTDGKPKPEICEICGRGGKICFDHSHANGKFRGWICNHCNLALGHVADDIEILKKLIFYLERN